MTERERSLIATQKLQQQGIECIIDSVRRESITVLCGLGVIAYYQSTMLSLGEQISLNEAPLELFVVDKRKGIQTVVSV